MDIYRLAEEIKADKQPREITPRQLFNAFNFERRTSGNCFFVDRFLNENSLMVEPHYNEVWIDDPICLKHKPMATTNIPIDPIRRINILDSATNIPTFVDNSASLLEATTLMQINGFSQLPVTNKGVRGLVGYISWETICQAKINGVESDMVKDYVEPNVAILSPDTPLIHAVEIVKKHDFAVVLAKDKSLFGIVTVSDITNQFIAETEPFVLMNELENHIRNLMRDKILLEDLKRLCERDDKKISSIDDLTFGDYIVVFGNEEQWNKLHIAADRKEFILQMNEIREIRNEIMHFRPTGIDDAKRCRIKSVVKYLRKLIAYQHK